MAKTLDEHFGYLADSVKVEAYRAALAQTVKPGDVVIDLGCGSGLLGMLAFGAGAGKVLFVEEGEVLELARKTVTDAGLADKAGFFKSNSFELTLPEPADLVVCDHIGYFGFDYGVLPLLRDAKKRFLKPDGIVMPASIDLKLAVVESEQCRSYVERWRDGSVPPEFAWVTSTAANTTHSPMLEGEHLLAAPEKLGALELGREVPPFFSMNAEFRCTRDGLLDGLAGHFECQLVADICMTNEPGARNSLDRPQCFLPLERPVEVQAGEKVRATVMARPLDYVIAWVIELPESGRRFEYSTFNGLLLDPASLSDAELQRVAALNVHGKAIQVLLSYCDGSRSVGEVQELMKRDHAELFPSERAFSGFLRYAFRWVTGK